MKTSISIISLKLKLQPIVGSKQQNILLTYKMRRDIMTFEERLQKLRNENRLSQDKIAELVGVSRQAASKWKNDLSYPAEILMF